jgi:hypothetical protein
MMAVAPPSRPHHHEREEAQEDRDDRWSCWMAHVVSSYMFLSLSVPLLLVLLCCLILGCCELGFMLVNGFLVYPASYCARWK